MTHKIIVLFGATVMFLSSLAQQSNDNPKWIESMQNPKANFYETQRLFYEYWEDKTPGKGDGYKPFKRWEWFYELEVNEEGEIPDYNKIAASVAAFKINSNSKDAGSGADTLWENIGPITKPVASSGQPNGMGRINALGIHPNNDSIIFAGAPNAGLWRSYDQGSTWQSNSDTLFTMQISSINFNPKNPQIVYAGTGDRDATSRTAKGVLKSTDGGITWKILNSGMGNVVVGKMIIDPIHPDTILAATSNGIYKTTNGGVRWTKKGTGTNYKDIDYAPNDFNKIYATGGGTFWYSHDNGENWTRGTGYMSGSRGAIAVSKHKPNYVYFIQTSNRVFTGLYRSTDYGKTFSTRSTTPNIMDYDINGRGNGGQAWYNLDIVANPFDAEEIFVGGVNIFKSNNGGQTWTNAAHWLGAVHADQHVLEYSADGKTLLVGNDGGVYYSKNNGANWVNISSGLPISEIYKLGQNKFNENGVICGYQDNGTAIYRGNNSWTTEIGGDGMECAFDHIDPNYVYGELYYGAIRRSSNGGRNFGSITNNIPEQGAWVSPFILGENDPKFMFAGYINIYRTSNVRTGSVQWQNITTSISPGANATFRVLEQSPANTNILYTVRSDGRVYRSDNCKATTPSWTDITAQQPTGGFASDVEAHPFDENIVYITKASKVYVSTNKGMSWTDISKNLPSSTKRTIVYDEYSQGGLYVGGTPGVYYIDSTMSNWVDYSQSLPGDVSVTELEIAYNKTNPAKSKIRAATYGRGLWSAPMFDVESRFAKAEMNNKASSHCAGDTIVLDASSSKNATGFVWSIQPATYQLVNGSVLTDKEISVVILANGYYNVSLVASNFFNSDTLSYRNLLFVDASTAATCATTTSSSSINGSGIFETSFGNQTMSSIGFNGSQSNTNTSCSDVFFLELDSNYSVSVKTGNTNAEFVSVYIDFNGNGSFADAGERVYQGQSALGSHTFTYKAPNQALVNKKLLMRVISDRQAISNSCAALSHGESRDYGVVFEKPELSIFSSSRLVCPNEPVNVSYSSNGRINSISWDFGDGATPVKSNSFGFHDVTYAWGGKKIISARINDKVTFYDTINVRFSPYANLVVDSAMSNLCETGNALLRLIDSSGAINPNYQWFRNNTAIQVQGDTLFSQRLFNRFNLIEFFVVVNDSFCVDTSEVLSLVALEQPIAQMAGFKAVQCLEGNNYPFNDNTIVESADFTRKWDFGDGTFTFSKSQNYNYRDTGLYTVQLKIVANNGCEDSMSVQVKVNPNPISTFTTKTIKDLQVSFIPLDTNWSQYQWDFGDGNTSQSKNPTHTYAKAGLYQSELVVTSKDNCASSTKSELEIEKPVGRGELFNEKTVVVYPNPSTEQFTLKLPSLTSGSITVFDIMGAEIIHNEFEEHESNQQQFNLYQSGMYLVKIQLGNQSIIKQVIVE